MWSPDCFGNLKAIYLQMDDFASALLVRAAKLMALLADRAEEHAISGCSTQLDRPAEAIDPRGVLDGSPGVRPRGTPCRPSVQHSVKWPSGTD